MWKRYKEDPEEFPKLSTIFDVEDKLRRNRNEHDFLKWEHQMLMKAFTDGPKKPWRKRIAARLRYRTTKLWRTVISWLTKRKDNER